MVGTKILPKSTKLGSKILSKSFQNRSQEVQNPPKIGPKRPKSSQNRSQEASWRGLGRSWAQDGPKRAPTAKMYKKPKHFHPPLGRQNPPKIDPKSIPKAINFCNDFLMDFWWILGAKNRAKIYAKIKYVFGCLLDRFLKIFDRFLDQKSFKNL